MKAYTYLAKEIRIHGKTKPRVLGDRDAVVRVTLASICTSDLHIRHGLCRAPSPGSPSGTRWWAWWRRRARRSRSRGRPRRRQRGNVLRRVLFLPQGICEQLHRPRRRLGAWLPHRRRSGGVCPRAVRGHGSHKIPDGVSDEQALFVGDILATGYWAADIAEIGKGDAVLVIGAGPTGICAMLCARLKSSARVIVCEKIPSACALCASIIPTF